MTATSRVPAGARKPQDRKPAAKKAAAKKASPQTVARHAEATDGHVTVEVLGLSLRIPIGESVPLAAYMAFEREDELAGTELLLGEDQWAEFMGKKPSIGDFNEVGRQMQELTGNL